VTAALSISTREMGRDRAGVLLGVKSSACDTAQPVMLVVYISRGKSVFF